MKKLFFSFAVVGLFLTSCESAPNADSAETSEAQEVANAEADANYTADLTQSAIEWIGTKPVGKHHGTFMLKEGTLMTNDGEVSGGKFVIDMNSLKALDQDSLGNAKLGGHLLSADFFDAAQFPTSTFEIVSVANGLDTTNKDIVMKDATHTITGNLTLKDVTKSISFPAKIVMTEGNITTDASFNIDRTVWNITYGNDQSLGDKFINPIVNLTLHIVANK